MSAEQTIRRISETAAALTVFGLVAWFALMPAPQRSIAAEAPMHAQLAQSELAVIYPSRIWDRAQCKALDVGGAWYIRCTAGRSMAIWLAVPGGGPKGYVLEAVNGKAIQHLGAGHLGGLPAREATSGAALPQVIEAFNSRFGAPG